MERIFETWNPDEIILEQEPSRESLQAMATRMGEIARGAGYPLWGVDIRAMKLSDHVEKYGRFQLTPGWTLDGDEVPKLHAYIESLRSKLGRAFDPVVVTFILDVDSSG